MDGVRAVAQQVETQADVSGQATSAAVSLYLGLRAATLGAASAEDGSLISFEAVLLRAKAASSSALQ